MSSTSSNDLFPNRTRWWRERELWLLIGLAVMTYCLRLSSMPLFGEEPRRALIAREMVETGDWLVPCTQRVFLPSRPPLQNWLIAIAGFAFGTIDIWATRLPSILSVIATAVMLYGYLRQQNSRFGSFAGGIAFATMQLVMEFARSGETEAVFTVFVAGSLILWHWGWIKRWPVWKMWTVGYTFAALGMLTKGIQAPVYFCGATFLFLVFIGRWRELFSWGHLIGIASFLVVFGAWQIPFTIDRGVKDSWDIYFGDVAGRFVERRWGKFFGHLVTYPFELLFVRLMPWSILLFALFQKDVRHRLNERRETVAYLAIGIALSFVSVWLPTGSKVRYYMPMFPSFAALIGIAIDCIAAGVGEETPSRLWDAFARSMSGVMAGTAVVVLVVSALFWSLIISLPVGQAIGFSLAAFGLACVVWESAYTSNEASMFRQTAVIALFLALVQVNLITTVQENRIEDVEGQISQLKQQLPSDAQLVSLGKVHHAFAFFYRQPIPIVKFPAESFPADLDYFCLHTYEDSDPKLPFEWTELAVINCDRFRNQPLIKDRVFVGRRVSAIEPKSEEPNAGDH